MRETEKMIEFMIKSDDYEAGNFADIVVPADPLSEQILDLNCSIKAR